MRTPQILGCWLVVACGRPADRPPAAPVVTPVAAAPVVTPVATAPVVAVPVAAPPTAPPPPPIPLDEAKAMFDDAAALCEADHGALWGVSLCGPLMVVERDHRFVVASQADAEGKLRPQGGVFVGELPPDQNIANTSVTWAGVTWVELAWPLPATREDRALLVMHESFHRIAEQAHVPKPAGDDNAHLDQLDGRITLQLEWRALAAALQATAEPARRAAVADALALRRARRGQFAGSADHEDALELNEGLAEYTGVVVGRPAERVAVALHDLEAHVGDPSFVRSFAYATGPAYGLLLDRYAAGWRGRIATTRSLSGALAAALGAKLPDSRQAAARHGGAELRRAEQDRAVEHARLLARFRAQLVEGPVLRLGFRHMKLQLDPRNVLALDPVGSVYPTLRVVDAWGVLEVTGGALIAADWSSVAVAAPGAGSAASPIAGPGWTLALAPGWRVVPGPRAGDLRVTDEPR